MLRPVLPRRDPESTPAACHAEPYSGLRRSSILSSMLDRPTSAPGWRCALPDASLSPNKVRHEEQPVVEETLCAVAG